MDESVNVTPTELDERLEQALATLDEKLQVEAITQLVENLVANGKLDQRIQQALHDLWQALQRQGFGFVAVQSELRDLMMDVALLKRAVSSVGQVGVLERQRIERELVLDLFPPRLVRPGTGVAVACPAPSAVEIDCENRLPLCKAACCRIFNVLLTAEEVENNKYDWNPRVPYALHKNRLGCVHLRSGDWSCSIYDCRPYTCLGYSCAKDQRIWADFEKRVVNSNLKQELDKLNGDLVASQADRRTTSSMAISQEWPSASPPDFSEVRSRTVPEPIRRFVRPEADKAEVVSIGSLNGNGEMQRELP